VLALCPQMYDDIWVAGKCMYKLEPVVADGGELIIYAPHITEISVTHGELIRRIGYHTRDYFLAQMDKFDDIPGGILAHSTHVAPESHLRRRRRAVPGKSPRSRNSDSQKRLRSNQLGLSRSGIHRD